MPILELSTGESSNSTTDILVLDGELDIYSTPRLQDALTTLLDGPTNRIVIDCSKLDFIDSSGLGALVFAYKKMTDRSGELAIAAPRDHVRRVLNVTGLDRVLPVFDNVAAACAN